MMDLNKRAKNGADNRLKRLGFTVLTLMVMALCIPPNTMAQSAAEKPAILVVLTGRTMAAQQRERAFITELQLALDNYRIVSDTRLTRVTSPSFSEMSLREQLLQVRKLARSHRAVAVIWLTDDSGEDVTLLQLAALSTGRALIRVVEAQNGPDTEVTLAMAVEELVGQAYLFDAKNPAAALEASVISASSKEGSAEKNKNTTAESARNPVASQRMFQIEGIGRAGIAGVRGPRLSLGASVGLAQLFFDRVWVGGGLNLVTGPSDKTSLEKIENRSLEPYVGVGIYRSVKHMRFGVVLHISVPHQQTVITFPETGTHVYDAWNMRYALRFALQVSLGPAVSVALSPELGLWVNQKRYYAESTDRDIVRNPRVDGGLLIALIIKN
ncbi:MAG: hypothetical protein JXX29_03355 [Deltaproteobacteria bacterium]|nr:hypothetical protein [Deltaproteobacteria bacterium]MBN2670679.1 hypothetical protein [Deltaproteobacteria bacterium]